jgi:hypothetical protein
MAVWPDWTPADHCTGSATPGAQALMRWIIERYGSKGAQNWGIYNCRDVVGASTTSLHGEGRALDVGFPLGDPDADELRKRLIRVPGRLGIQAVIYERVIYSQKSPEGRPYTGEAPHYDHLHIELTREAARELTYATVASVLSPPARTAGSRTLEPGKKGADVKWLQRKLRVQADGQFGPSTAKAVEDWKRQWNKKHPKRTPFPINPVVGKRSWVRLGVKPTY